MRKLSENDREMPQSHSADQPNTRTRQITITNTWHQEYNKSKTTNSLFLIEIIAKLKKDTTYCITKQGPNINPYRQWEHNKQ